MVEYVVVVVPADTKNNNLLLLFGHVPQRVATLRSRTAKGLRLFGRVPQREMIQSKTGSRTKVRFEQASRVQQIGYMYNDTRILQLAIDHPYFHNTEIAFR